MRPPLPFIAFSVLIAALPAQSDWSRFRGPDGQGLAVGDAPLPDMLDVEHGLLWKCPLPPGHSSPCVSGDRIFVTGYRDDQLETICVDRSTGDVVWRRALEPAEIERHHDVNSPASATPASDGARVFVYFGSVGILCYDRDGDEVWRRELPLPKNIFGSASSPIVAGGRVILVRDTNAESVLEAMDPATGEVLWKVDREGFKSGWSTPAVWRRDGIDELLVNGAWWLTAYDLRDGATRWSLPGLTDEPAITPATNDGLVFVTSYNMNSNPEVIGLPVFEKLLEDYDTNGDGKLDRDEAAKNASVLSRFDADGEGDHPLRMFFRFLDEDRSGDLTADEWQGVFEWLAQYQHANAVLAIRPATAGDAAEIVWQYPRGVPECPSPLFYDGRVYVVKNGGIVTSLDAGTGELRFEGRTGARGPHYASPVAGDGKVFTASARGVVTVLAAGDELRVLGRTDLGERIMATPALVDGRVFVRTERHLFAFATPRNVPAEKR